ncbi:MAG: hypothetical protein K2X77_21600 [Candidatus Obscuribacterales bacterium]|jgi:hypothetical protein|nr:hypothetical protein [Candidatus Obscuribacterales bacterium]
MSESSTTELQVGPGQVIQIKNFVAKEKCSQWLEQVILNPQCWENRFDYINSYGSCWYLDIEAGMLSYYYANAVRTNELLKGLPNFVETLASSAKYLQAPDGKTGLPTRPRHENLGPYWVEAGVVIMNRGTAGVEHADYEGLAPYPEKLFDSETRAYSAVLCLAAADSGGNLRIWKQRVLGNEEPALAAETEEEVFYEPGALVLFDSFCYHQITESVLSDDHRYRAIGALHFLYKEQPYPHWEYWF